MGCNTIFGIKLILTDCHWWPIDNTARVFRFTLEYLIQVGVCSPVCYLTRHERKAAMAHVTLTASSSSDRRPVMAAADQSRQPFLRGLLFGAALSLPVWIAMVYLALRLT